MGHHADSALRTEACLSASAAPPSWLAALCGRPPHGAPGASPAVVVMQPLSLLLHDAAAIWKSSLLPFCPQRNAALE